MEGGGGGGGGASTSTPLRCEISTLKQVNDHDIDINHFNVHAGALFSDLNSWTSSNFYVAYKLNQI